MSTAGRSSSAAEPGAAGRHDSLRSANGVVLHAPLDRVWRAISDADEFGRWFGVRFDGPFIAGGSVGAAIAPTTVDDEVARRQEPHAGTRSTWQNVGVAPQTA